MTTQLTNLETTVLAALKQNAEDCSGGDFAISEEVNYRKLGLKAQAFGGVLTSLQTKGILNVDVTYVNRCYGSRGTKVTQITFNDAEGGSL